ncbi:RadC family protein [Pseudokordiimonas caeni]|uniref:RadC family protein n=1 Tax=Pseudokordiimonas caeni TaxID=2997908 RepID=UPI00281245A4|nr:DNA repair protein RadC [Pseudokordiimonas caeni]
MTDQLFPETPVKDHTAGHRQRLRERFLKAGPDGVADYELLELLLFLAIPRRDVKPMAKGLITRFGSLGRLLAADAGALRAAGLSDAMAATLLTVKAAALHMAKEQVTARPVLSNWQALLDYLRLDMADDTRERFRVLFLDRKNVLVADEVQGEGTVDQTPVYPREVVRRALELGASALILVHNHPSGDTTPSRADIAMTKEVSDACSKLGIAVHDHLIIGLKGHTSFKSEGLI